MSIGRQIKRARQLANLTQIQLGQQIGQPTSVISAWENEARIPGAKNLQQLSSALEKSISFFYEEDVPTISLTKTGSESEPQSPKPIGVGHRGEILFIGQPPYKKEDIMKKQKDCVEIKDDSFSPVFSAGDIVWWDYTLAPKPGAYILVQLTSGKYTFGKMIEDQLTDLHGKPLQGTILAAVFRKIETKNLY